jgi:uncharacterized membrane protein YphA (DoxX/SURF4 family)
MSPCSWKVSCSDAALSLLIQLPTQTRERSNYSALLSMKFLTADNLHELSDYLTVPLRVALALSFLFPVADRLGMLGPPGTPEVAWGNFTNFLAYNAQVNSFLPVAIRPTLGVTATVFEILFGVTLFLGVYTRLFAAGAGICCYYSAARWRSRSGSSRRSTIRCSQPWVVLCSWRLGACIRSVWTLFFGGYR